MKHKNCTLILCCCVVFLITLTGCLFEPPKSNQEKLMERWTKPYSYGLNEVEYWFSPTGRVFVKDVAYCSSSGSSLVTKSGTYEATNNTVTISFSSGDVLFNYYFSSSGNYLNLYNYDVNHELRKQ